MPPRWESSGEKHGVPQHDQMHAILHATYAADTARRRASFMQCGSAPSFAVTERKNLMADTNYSELATRLTDPATPLPAPSAVLSGDAAAAEGRAFLLREYGSEKIGRAHV